MKKESVLFGIIGLLIGVVITGFVAGQAVNSNNTGMMRMMGMDTNKTENQPADDHASMSMEDMTEQLKTKTGDDFDKAFIEMMIIHHQGAIEMAKLTETNAKHDEIKQLGQDIMSAQSKEIDMMQGWQTDWGYKTTPMSHDMNNM